MRAVRHLPLTSSGMRTSTTRTTTERPKRQADRGRATATRVPGVAQHLTIGIPLRNELGNISRFLSSLKAAASRLPGSVEIETIFCLNGSTDGTEQVLRASCGELRKCGLNPLVITSNEGKMIAQGTIARNRQYDGPICFLDADVIVDRDCLRMLWETMEGDASIQVVYATVVPDVGPRPSAAQRFQMMHYAVRDRIYQRKYFHGRTFIIRSWDVPDFENAAWQSDRQRRVIGANVESLRLERGPQIDDVFLSRLIAHEFGLDAIVEAPTARVRFVPPATFRDFYLGHRRLWIEIHRLNLLFEEHRYLQTAHFEQRLNCEQWRRLPMPRRLQYFAYRIAEVLAKRLARCEIRLAEWSLRELRPQWPALASTKSFAPSDECQPDQQVSRLSMKVPYRRTA